MSKGTCLAGSRTYTTGSGTGCPICARKIPLTGETDLASCNPQLAQQWHPTLNGSLKADQVLPGSHRLVWWMCEKGHVWRAQIKSRAEGCGCPVCANREIIAQENDLASRFPSLAKQWHPTKNGALTPDMVAAGSTRKVWWRCEKGHEWRAVITSRTTGSSGCPVCTGKKIIPGENDLASCFPEIAAQWHPEKNESLMPTQVSPSSNRKVWWKCPLGHDYQAVVGARTVNGSGCPYCAGRKVLPGFNDLASLEPEVAKQWHPTLNGSLTPEKVTPGSHYKVWWECAEGHVWQAVVYSRTGVNRTNCPVCAGHVNGKRLKRYQAMFTDAQERMNEAAEEAWEPSEV